MFWQIVGIIIAVFGVALWMREQTLDPIHGGARTYVRVAAAISVVIGGIMVTCSGPLPWQ